MPEVHKIGVIHATRGRPKRGVQAARRLIDNCTSGLPVTYIFTLDSDDPELSNYQEEFKSLSFNFRTSCAANRGPIEAQNRAARMMADEDLFMIFVDDMAPPKGWDTEIVEFVKKIPNDAYLIHIKNIQNSEDKVMIPMMSRGLYNKLGWVFYPEYISMYADDDLFQTAKALGCLYSISLGFVHEHPIFGLAEWDETYRRTNRPDSYAIGREVFLRRQAAGFGAVPAGGDQDSAQRPAALKHVGNPLHLPQNPDYYRMSREHVAQALLAQGVQARRMIELGCSRYVLGRNLKQVVNATYYAGVDSSEEAARPPQQLLDKVYQADMEKTAPAELGLAEDEFDLLVALDFLERLRNPWDRLADWVKVVRRGGHAVFAVPNVQNISVVHGLVHGRWAYEGSGLLGTSHVRFFTLQGMVDLLTGAGLVDLKIVPMFWPQLDVNALRESGNTFQQDKLTISNLTKDEVVRLYAYKYIITARRAG